MGKRVEEGFEFFGVKLGQKVRYENGGNIYKIIGFDLDCDDSENFIAINRKPNGVCNDVLYSDCISVYSEGGCYSWVSLDEIEIIKDFSKKDIESGMKLVLRNGDVAIVIGEFLQFEFGYDILRDWNNDLRYDDDSEFDIMKAYKITEGRSVLHYEITDSDELIWEREEKSKEQIELEELEKEAEVLNSKIDKLKELLNTKED